MGATKTTDSGHVKHAFCRTMLVLVMKTVRKHTTVKERWSACAWKQGLGDSCNFTGPPTEEGEKQFFWCGDACCKWAARACGWSAWLEKMGIEPEDDMKILSWEKPKKARSTEEHNEGHQSDTGIPGTYVPNMGDADKRTWKAKKIGGKRPRVEIRKTTDGPGLVDGKNTYAQMILVVTMDAVQFSSNGKSVMSAEELMRAISEAREALRGATAKRDPDAECEHFKEGPVDPDFECYSDGHYLCDECKHNARRL